MDETAVYPVAQSIERILDWASTNLPQLPQSLRRGASEGELNRLEVAIGQPLPTDFRALYRIADGQSERLGLFLGLPFSPLSQIAQQWSRMASWHDVAQSSSHELSSFPPDTVQPVHYSSGWVPITEDGGGNFMGNDLSPGPAGNIGQWIIFGADEDQNIRVASSLSAFLHWIAGEMENGQFRPAEGEGGVMHPLDRDAFESGMPVGVSSPPDPNDWRWRNHSHLHQGLHAFLASGERIG